MDIRGLVLISAAVAISFAPQFVNTSNAQAGGYSAELISPVAGQVLHLVGGLEVDHRHIAFVHVRPFL